MLVHYCEGIFIPYRLRRRWRYRVDGLVGRSYGVRAVVTMIRKPRKAMAQTRRSLTAIGSQDLRKEVTLWCFAF